MLKLKLLILLIFAGIKFQYAQEGFTIKNERKSTKIKFELVNNLIIVPVELNGLQLSFLVDTGVKTTVLLNLSEEDTTELNPFEKIQLRGLGGEDLIQAFRSRNNELKIGKIENSGISVFVIYDENINFSPRLGVPVHGIIGYDLFMDFVVEINYPRRYLRLHDPQKFSKKLKGYQKLPLQFYQDKPYVTTELKIEDDSFFATLLLDNGLSDAVWLFPDSLHIKVPQKSYPDFLGLGLSGDVTGRRAKITSMSLGENTLEEVTAAFPDSLSVEGLQTYHARNGSIGSEIMRRFHLVFDYNKNVLFIKKNKWFDQEFHYDMSGIVLEHSGFTVVESFERIPGKRGGEEDNVLIMEPAFYKKFELKPAFKIARLRKDSPAMLAGLQVGDEVTRVNNKNAYKMGLDDFVNLFSSEEGKQIKMEVLRNGRKLTFNFELKEQ